MPAVPAEAVHALRRVVGDCSPLSSQGRLIGLGVASLDHALGGGLASEGIHEISPAHPLHRGAATGFVLTLLALALAADGEAGTGSGKNQAGDGHAVPAAHLRQVVWIQPDFTAAEAGALYGPGLDLIGFPMESIVILRAPRPGDALWAMEEALKCPAAGAVVAELPSTATDLTAMRRLSLAAHGDGGIGLILRDNVCSLPSTAVTRWEVAAGRSESDHFGGLGPATFALSLVKNRRGPTGQWRLSWNHHERAFVLAPLPLPVAPAARDGSLAPLRVRAGRIYP